MKADYDFAIGRAIARVRRSWTTGAYSRHADGRSLRTGVGVSPASVDIVAALRLAAVDLGYDDAESEKLRDFVTEFLPHPWATDRVFGLEHFNDYEGRTLSEVIAVLEKAKEAAWAESRLPFPSVSNAA